MNVWVNKYVVIDWFGILKDVWFSSGDDQVKKKKKKEIQLHAITSMKCSQE